MNHDASTTLTLDRFACSHVAVTVGVGSAASAVAPAAAAAPSPVRTLASQYKPLCMIASVLASVYTSQCTRHLRLTSSSLCALLHSTRDVVKG